MAARFGTLGNNRRGSTTCHEARQRHRGNDRDDLDARLVPRLMYLAGLPAPVTTTGTRSSITTCATSSANGLMSMTLTPKGLSVLARSS